MVAGLAALSGLAGAMVTFGAGKSMLRSSVGVGALSGAAGDLLNDLIDAAYKTLQTRAIIAVVVVIVLGVVALAARGPDRPAHRAHCRPARSQRHVAAQPPRWQRAGNDPRPRRYRLALSLIAIVLAWLPPNQRFAHDVKASRQT